MPDNVIPFARLQARMVLRDPDRFPDVTLIDTARAICDGTPLRTRGTRPTQSKGDGPEVA